MAAHSGPRRTTASPLRLLLLLSLLSLSPLCDAAVYTFDKVVFKDPLFRTTAMFGPTDPPAVGAPGNGDAFIKLDLWFRLVNKNVRRDEPLVCLCVRVCLPCVPANPRDRLCPTPGAR